MSTVIRFEQEMPKPTWAVNAEIKMRSLGLQQSDLLKVFGVKTTGAIGHYFNGRRDPGVEKVLNLAKYLNMSIGQLVGEEKSLEVNFLDGSNKFLTDALRILTRTVHLDDKELHSFFSVYEKLGAENIIKATNALLEAGSDSDAQFDAIINIQDFMKKAS